MHDLINLQADRGSDTFYEPGFRQMIEDHLDYLRRHPKTTAVQLSPAIVGACVGDLTGILDRVGLTRGYHWVVMRMNGIDAANQVDEKLTAILLPELAVVDQLRSIYRTQRSNTTFA